MAQRKDGWGSQVFDDIFFVFVSFSLIIGCFFFEV